MNKAFVIFIAILLSLSISAQTTWDEVMGKLNKASIAYLTSFIQKDWDTYMNLTYPNIISMAGGKEILQKIAEENISMYRSLGFEMQSVKIGEDIRSVDSPEGIQALIPAAVVMKNGAEQVEIPIKLFAVSGNLGETWKFVDLSQYDAKSIKQFIPGFDNDLLVAWTSN